MKLIALGLLLAASACASAPKEKTPEEALLGAWNCKSQGDNIAYDGMLTYKPGGMTDVAVTVKTNRGGIPLEIAGEGQASWVVVMPDAPMTGTPPKIQETMKAVKVTRATANGNPFDLTLAQGFADQMLVGQSNTSTLEATPTSLTLKSEDGLTTTTCTR